MDNQEGPPMWYMELCSMLCGSLDGRGIWRRMDTCICMAESLHCSPETIIILLIGYTPKTNNYGLWVIMLCQCGFTSCDKCTTLMRAIENGETVSGGRVYAGNIYTSLQFCYESKTALLKVLMKTLKKFLSARIYYFSQIYGLDKWFCWSEAIQLGFNGWGWSLTRDSSPHGHSTFERLLWAGTHKGIKVPSTKLTQVSTGQRFSSLCLHDTFYYLIYQSLIAKTRVSMGHDFPHAYILGGGDSWSPLFT